MKGKPIPLNCLHRVGRWQELVRVTSGCPLLGFPPASTGPGTDVQAQTQLPCTYAHTITYAHAHIDTHTHTRTQTYSKTLTNSKKQAFPFSTDRKPSLIAFVILRGGELSVCLRDEPGRTARYIEGQVDGYHKHTWSQGADCHSKCLRLTMSV